jgi:hypothetical protein
MKYRYFLSRTGFISAIIFLLLMAACPVMAHEVWTTGTVDMTSSDVGQHNSLAIDPAGNPHISYYDDENKQIRYAAVVDGSWTNGAVADSRSTHTTSLALDPEGNPGISYGDGDHDGKLMYAHLNGGWTTETVASDSGHADIGTYSSLAIDSAGTPHISYNNGKGNYDTLLEYATRNGTVWTSVTPDPKILGYDSSMVLDSSGLPHIAYLNGMDSGYIAYGYQDTPGKWSTRMVANTEGRGGDMAKNAGCILSLALDSEKNPHIAYFDKTRKELMYAFWDGKEWITEIVDQNGETGWHPSLAMYHDQPSISYYDISRGELRFATRDPATQKWVPSTVDKGGVGSDSSLAFDSTGNPGIAYYDGKHHALKYASGKPL